MRKMSMHSHTDINILIHYMHTYTLLPEAFSLPLANLVLFRAVFTAAVLPLEKNLCHTTSPFSNEYALPFL